MWKGGSSGSNVVEWQLNHCKIKKTGDKGEVVQKGQKRH